MKNLKSTLSLGLPIVLILFGLLATFGDFLPVQGAYEYSDQTLEAEKIYTSIASDLTQAQSTLLASKAAYESAISTEQSIQVTLCAQQLVLAQLKYSDTDPSNTAEVERLQTSITNAQACIGAPKTGF